MLGMLGLYEKSIKIAKIRKNTTDTGVNTTNTDVATTDLLPSYSYLAHGNSYVVHGYSYLLCIFLPKVWNFTDFLLSLPMNYVEPIKQECLWARNEITEKDI